MLHLQTDLSDKAQAHDVNTNNLLNKLLRHCALQEWDAATAILEQNPSLLLLRCAGAEYGNRSAFQIGLINEAYKHILHWLTLDNVNIHYISYEGSGKLQPTRNNAILEEMAIQMMEIFPDGELRKRLEKPIQNGDIEWLAKSLNNIYESTADSRIDTEHMRFDAASPLASAAEVNFLMKKFKLSQNDAIAEIRELSLDDVLILEKFYSYGLRGHDIRALKENNDYQFYAFYNGSGNPANIDTLRYFHLDAWGRDFFDWCIDRPYNTERSHQASLLKVKLEYCEKTFKAAIKDDKTPRDALHDCVYEFHHVLDRSARMLTDMENLSNALQQQKTSYERDKFLNRHANEGVRVADIPAGMFPNPNEPHSIKPDLLKTYKCLHFFSRASVRDSLQQIRDLTDDQLSILRKYYKRGVRKEMLNDCTLDLTQFEAFLCDTKMSPVAALRAMQEGVSIKLKK